MEKPKLARVFWFIGLAPVFCHISLSSNLAILSRETDERVRAIAFRHVVPMAIAAEIRYWEYDPYTNELQVTSEETPQYFILADPPRIVIDVPNSNFGKNTIQENYPGLVRTIRISEFKPGQTRIVMELDPTLSLSPGQVELEPLGQGNRWAIRPQLRVSQTLPSLESTGTLPPLPSVTQMGDRLEPATVPPLPTAKIPISSEIGLPTDRVTPTLGNNNLGSELDDRNITVTVPSLNEVYPTTENSNGNAEAFIPPPPPPGWQVDREVESAEIVSVPPLPSTPESVEAIASTTQSVTQITPQTNTLPGSGNLELPDTTSSASSSAIVALHDENAELENTSSLPPYSEWQEITPSDSSPEIASTAPSVAVITFGQSLPKPANPPNIVTAVNSTNLPNHNNHDEIDPNINPSAAIEVEPDAETLNSDVLVAAGTMMILRYPGSEAFTLKNSSSRREVLVVDVEIYDRNGEVIAPGGTPVIGSFESDRSGSRFVVESILLEGQMVPVVAESETMTGDRSGSGGGLLSWSTLGAVGGAAIGSLAGGPLLGGAAAGVAANLLSSSKSEAIEPGQIIPVQVLEHWRVND